MELFAWACANMYRIDTDAYKLNFCLCVGLTDVVANAVDVRKLNAVWSNNRYDIDLFLMKSKNVVCNISINSQCEIKWNIYHFIPRFLNERQSAKAWCKYELDIALNFASSFWSFLFWAAIVEELAVQKWPLAEILRSLNRVTISFFWEFTRPTHLDLVQNSIKETL